MLDKLMHYFKKLFALIVIYGCLIFILVSSKDISNSVKLGVEICLNTLVPSLFFFMIFSSFIASSKLGVYVSMPFSFLSKYVFKINLSDLSIVLLSLLGGYPVGARLLSNKVRENKISPKKASLMLSYCVNCSPAFLITTVGLVIFNNAKIGLVIYLSQVVACLIIGFIVSFSVKCEKDDTSSKTKDYPPYSIILVNSVNDSIKAMALMCGFVVAFAAVTPAFNIILANTGDSIKQILSGLMEVTNGCNSLSNSSGANPILLAALFTSFGGVCVHMQTYAMLHKTNIKISPYLLYRVLYCFISVGLVKLYITLFPESLNCISLNSSISSKTYSISPISTVFLFLTCIMLLFFSNKSDKIKE